MKSIEYWNKQKRHLMRVLRYARIINSKKGIEDYSKAVNKCDLKIGVISAMQKMVGVVILLACLIIGGYNFAREGLYGTGRCIGALGEDVKWTIEQLAGNIETKEK